LENIDIIEQDIVYILQFNVTFKYNLCTVTVYTPDDVHYNNNIVDIRHYNISRYFLLLFYVIIRERILI